MKKLLIGAAFTALAAFAVSAQVMPASGVENTLWTGLGSPFSGDAKYFGFVDTLQARVDVGKFTVEGMLNWGALSYWETDDDFDKFIFTNTETNALNRHYNDKDNDDNYKNTETVPGYSNAIKSQTEQDSYYVNFLWHPVNNFDFGMGTKLNWRVGPAPTYGSWVWGSDAHIRQGGFSTAYNDKPGEAYKHFTPDAPGSADVVGFVHYANTYAKKAIAARYNYQGDFGLQIGAAIPDGADTDSPVMNLGVELRPVDWLSIATAYEGLLQKRGDFYAGVTVGAKSFILDAYFACDNIASDYDDDMAFGTGAGITFAFPKVGITIRPEAGLNWFENSSWTPAWYAGGLFKFDINEKMILQAWTSFAVGSKDKDWDDNVATEDWNGGHIFDIRPEFTFCLNKNNSLSAYIDIESRKSFDGKTRDCWTTGFFWTYKMYTGKLTVAKKR